MNYTGNENTKQLARYSKLRNFELLKGDEYMIHIFGTYPEPTVIPGLKKVIPKNLEKKLKPL